MKIKITRRKDLIEKPWSGGMTTELTIFPSRSTYASRNFQFRLSTATIETDESVFTSLPGVERILMVLEGGLTLAHEGHHTVRLEPFEQDTFMGDWNTISTGRATDFNLMLRGNCKGKIEGYTIGKNFQDVAISRDDYVGIYVYDGSLLINYLYDKIELKKGDFVMLFSDQEYEEKAILSTETEAVIIQSSVTTG